MCYRSCFEGFGLPLVGVSLGRESGFDGGVGYYDRQHITGQGGSGDLLPLENTSLGH